MATEPNARPHRAPPSSGTLGEQVRPVDVALLGTSGVAELTTLAAALVFTVPFVAFPASPGRGAGVLNRHILLLGYALGFLVPFVTATTRRFVAGS